MPAVAAALAWVTRLLWFASRDMANIVTDHMEAIKRTLTSLRRQPHLQPSNGNFTTAAFIVRALLDELLPRLGMDISIAMQPSAEAAGKASSQLCQSASVIMADSSKVNWAGANGNDGSLPLFGRTGLDRHGLADGDENKHKSSAAADAANQTLLPREGWEMGNQPGSWLLDQRVLQLCCPQLDAARQALQVMLQPQLVWSSQVLRVSTCAAT